MNETYAQLIDKVDQFHDRVAARYPEALRCARGCSSCCHVHLSVVELEFGRLAAAVEALPSEQRRAIADRTGDGQTDPRCLLLDSVGLCRVYDARPLICRTHGLPIVVGGRRDVCQLNFVDGPTLEDIDASCVLDVDRLNAILGLIDRLTGGGQPRVDVSSGLAALLEVT